MQTTAPSRRRRLIRAALITSAVLVCLAMVARWSAAVEAYTFFHPRTTAHAAHPGFEDVTIPTPDGQQLHAWFMPARGLAPGQRAPAVLHCHGNMGDITRQFFASNYIPEGGVAVLLFDYRGFGRSTPCSFCTREALQIDTQAAYDYLRSRPDVDPTRIGVFGFSLGGTFALDLAARHPEIRCVAAVATFSSWPAVASDRLPVLGYLLIRSGMAAIDNAAALGNRPLLIAHGDRDSIVAYAHATRIVDAAKSAGVPAELLTIKGMGHMNAFEPSVQTRIREFFVKNLADAK